jgi:hypothetical protein
MGYYYKGLLAPKMFKTAPSAVKVVFTDIWDDYGVVHSEFKPTGTTINSEHYIGILQKLKTHI